MRIRSLVTLLALLCVPAALNAQEADPTSDHLVLPSLTGHAAERMRTESLAPGSPRPPSARLLRTTSSETQLPQGDRWLRLIAPSTSLVANSAIPHHRSDGALWAGRGVNLAVTAGAAFRLGPLTVIAAPTVGYSRNRSFDFVASQDPSRSRLQVPWRIGDTSADLPQRYGYDPFWILDPGESSVTLTFGGVGFGVATERQWWGPGARHAIVMSDNAPGIPHAFVRTQAPLHTRLGSFEGRWIAGALVESPFFDNRVENDLRSLSGVVLTYQPAWNDNLAFGASRVVYATAADRSQLVERAADVFLRWSRDPESWDAGEGVPYEQLFSLFGRWRAPGDAFELYGEWARVHLPDGLRDLLLAPHHTQGYVLGLQWARASGAGTVRLQSEVTYLEKSSTLANRPVPTYYASRHVQQGYTHRGRPVGAAIGPGSSAQWGAVDYLARAWQLGLFAQRIRWDNDAFYTTPVGDRYFGHDVSLVAGLRGALRGRAGELEAEAALEHRLNFLFQNTSYAPDREFAVDVNNFILRLRYAPPGRGSLRGTR